MMKKFILTFCAIALALSSCSKSDETTVDTPTVDTSSVLLKKRTYTYTQGTTQITNETNYSYNGFKLNKISHSSGKYEQYTYTGDLITKVDYYNSSNTLIQTNLYSYLNNRIDEVVEKNIVNNTANRKKYVYNSNGTASYNSYSGNLTTQSTLYNSGTLTFLSNGEISLDHYQNTVGGAISERIRTFDDKNSAMKNVVGYNKIIDTMDNTNGYYNNLLSWRYTYSGPTTAQDGFNYVYVYNSNNFPISMIETDLGGQIATEQYIYY